MMLYRGLYALEGLLSGRLRKPQLQELLAECRKTQIVASAQEKVKTLLENDAGIEYVNHVPNPQ